MSIFDKDENNEQEYTSITGENDDNNTPVSESAGETPVTMEEPIEAIDSEVGPEASATDDFTQDVDEGTPTGEISAASDAYYTSLTEAQADISGEINSKPKKTVPVWVIPLVAVIVIALCVGGFFAVKYVPSIVDNIKISSLVKNGKLNTALDEYTAIYNKDTTNKGAAKKAAGVMIKLGYFTDASSILTTAYTEEELNNTNDKELKNIWNTIAQVNATMEVANTIYSEVSSSSGEAEAMFQSAVSQIEEYKDNAEYHNGFIAYYEYLYASIFGQDLSVQKEYVEKACSDGGDLSHIFYPTLAAMNRYTKDHDQAISLCQTALEYNSEDYASYDEMSYNYLLKGEFDKAVENAKIAYELQPEQQTTVNALLLAYAASGDTESYESLSSEATAMGMEIDSMIQGYIDGTYTLENILIDGNSQ